MNKDDENWWYPHEFEITMGPVPFLGTIKGETNHRFVYQEKWDVSHRTMP
jgi:hypothetical protein